MVGLDDHENDHGTMTMTMAKRLAMTGLEPAHYAAGLEPAMFRSEV